MCGIVSAENSRQNEQCHSVFAWSHQPKHTLNCSTSSGCTFLCGTHRGRHASTRNRVVCVFRNWAFTRRIRKVKTFFSRSHQQVRAPNRRVVCLKKRPFSPCCNLAADEAHTSVSCKSTWLHDCVASSDRFFQWQVYTERKKKILRYGSALRQKKVSAFSNWWHTLEFRKWFALLISFESSMQKLNLTADRFNQRQTRRRRWRNM